MKIYYTRTPAEGFLREALAREYDGPIRLLRTNRGKPYLPEADAPKFSLTHTDGLLAVAIGPREVGLDAEKRAPRNVQAVLARLTPAERREDFFALWTAKESFIKYCGNTLAVMYRRLVYADGVLLLDGIPQAVSLQHFELAGCTLCLCTAAPEETNFLEL